MNQQKIIKKSILITSEILSWCVCLIPAILIFSNSIADIIVVLASVFFILAKCAFTRSTGESSFL